MPETSPELAPFVAMTDDPTFMPPEGAADLLPATGTDDSELTELKPEEEPNTTGTLFLTIIFLMFIFGFWVMMYLILLER